MWIHVHLPVDPLRSPWVVPVVPVRIVEHQIPILDTAKFAAIVGIGPKFGYNSVQRLAGCDRGWVWP